MKRRDANVTSVLHKAELLVELSNLTNFQSVDSQVIDALASQGTWAALELPEAVALSLNTFKSIADGHCQGGFAEIDRRRKTTKLWVRSKVLTEASSVVPGSTNYYRQRLKKLSGQMGLLESDMACATLCLKKALDLAEHYAKRSSSPVQIERFRKEKEELLSLFRLSVRQSMPADSPENVVELKHAIKNEQ